MNTDFGAAEDVQAEPAGDVVIDIIPELVQGVMQATGLSEAAAEKVVELVVARLCLALQTGERIQLRALGVWWREPRAPAITWVNGCRTVTPRPSVVRFRAAPQLTAQVQLLGGPPTMGDADGSCAC
ncbi:HU family DNA-binding protein [Deinococcus sp. HMF7604]|uniref:HU family DNA-binding protein n=1 Tax=Deinococcus betulae TaxID=2873312 RepID=UPI001CCE5445|nr:HU family DNA-binding protein [Deinococcus betulae]MBZ9751768.1 HU family DNA-binding protein [Deinococcus betulae]